MRPAAGSGRRARATLWSTSGRSAQRTIPAVTAGRFSDDDGFDFAVRCLLNGVPYRMADPQETIATAAAVTPGDSDGWYRALTDLGARSEAVAQRCDRAGHGVSAAQAYLRAANYRYAGFWYVLATAQREAWADAWRAHRRCLDAALDRWPTPAERVAVPWSPSEHPEANLEAWLFSPARPVGPPARLLVVQGGLGSPLSDSLMTGVVDAVDRGWHAVAFDGPGQGRARVEDGLGPVDDWGTVVTAVLDAVCARPALTDAVVALLGVADGGNLVIRAAATEPRVAAVVCDPGVVRPVDGALSQLPDALVAEWRAGDRDGFQRRLETAAAADPALAFSVAKLTEQWPGATVRDVLTRLTTWDATAMVDELDVPVLVADPDAAGAYPGQSAELVARLGDRATRIAFTTAEGAGLDCEIGAPSLRAQRFGDWLDATVAARISNRRSTEKAG